KTLWSTPTGNGIDSSPALAGDLLLIGCEDFFLYAMNASTGEVRWKYETGLGIASSPAVSGDLTVIGSKDGFLYALETQTGRLRWKTAVGEVVTAPPVIGGGVVCIQAGGTFALDSAAGKVVWRAALAGAVQSVPVLAGDVIDLLSNYKPDSALSNLNRSAHFHAEKVPSDLYRVIDQALEFSRLSDGKFDISIAPLVNLWKAALRGEGMPSRAQQEEVRGCVGYE